MPDDQGRLIGDGSYLSVGLRMVVDGDDLVVRGVRATWFGGDSDPDDDGRTASGVMTKGHPDCMGCALPMDLGPQASSNPCKGGPIPKLPYRDSQGNLCTMVRVYCDETGEQVEVPVIDLGPARPPIAHGAIDLTVAAYKALAPDHDIDRDITVDFRVLGAAKHLS